jgi:hypothetical protein
MKAICKLTLVFAELCALALFACVRLTAISGAGSETTNSFTGTIVNANGKPAAAAVVRCIPNTFDVVKEKDLQAGFVDTTDTLGEYRFQRIDTGTYTIQVTNRAADIGALVGGIHVVGDTMRFSAITLLKTGAIKIMLPGSIDKTSGYVYAPGTTLFKYLTGSSDYVVVDSVPCGVLPSINISSQAGADFSVLRYDVSVKSGDTTIIRRPSWKHANRLTLVTTSSGAGVAGTVTHFPVLVRLSSDNFDFSQAQAGGADLRFANQNDSDLPCEIARWDAAGNQAEIWVLADTILGNNDRQFMVMYWGNYQAVNVSSSRAVFDTALGFQGVWHLDEQGCANAIDGTDNHYDGQAFGMTAASSASGIIGKARSFDGSSSYIVMPNTANSKLNFPENGNFTVSSWVCLDSFDHIYRTVVSKGYQQYFLRFTYFPSNEPLWEFVNFTQSANWQASTFSATEKQWVLLTGVRQGSAQLLYCNGELVDSALAMYPQGLSRDTTNDLSIGRFLHEVTFPTIDGYCFFKGKIDEVCIAAAVRSGDWIRLCYMNQRMDDRLVRFN